MDRSYKNIENNSRLLTENVVDNRARAFGRSGMKIITDQGSVLEISGGSHATAIVNDGGRILQNASAMILKNGYALTGRGIRHIAQEELAEKICDLFNDPNARVFFTSGGTEAVETAIRLAIYIQKMRGKESACMIIGRKYSYHGMSLLTRNVADHPIHSILPTELNMNWPKLPEPNCRRCPLSFEEGKCSLQCASVLEEYISEYGEQRIAAIIIEPISGSTGGALLPPKGYIDKLSEICKIHNILFVSDETITAFGRTGKNFVSESKLMDIVVGGKTLGGGFIPINSVVISSRLCDEMITFNGNLPLRLTFSGVPIACYIALSVQNYIHENNLVERVRDNTQFINNELKNICNSEIPHAIVCGTGHLWALEIEIPKEQGCEFLAKMKKFAANEGIEFMGGIREGINKEYIHIMFTPPFDATKEELEISINSLVSIALLKHI
jgi:adenosylmethionine-8-amino-7-oxononanoate aminotransferase